MSRRRQYDYRQTVVHVASGYGWAGTSRHASAKEAREAAAQATLDYSPKTHTIKVRRCRTAFNRRKR